jgi:hypothetical protein
MTPVTIANSAAAFAAAGLAIVWRFSPTEYSFYPICPIARWTNLQCPGCGSTRALHALLHGHVFDAMQLNLMFTLIFPILFLWGAVQYWSAIRNGRFLQLQVPNGWYQCAALVLVVFGIVRNIPRLEIF